MKFEKIGNIKYVGHLDLLKVFQRTVKRADLPIAYSNGFNPHQQMSFALPLSLGSESQAEYIDIELTCDMDTDEIVARFNEAFPMGLRALSVKKVDELAKNGASMLYSAEYEITITDDIDVEKAVEIMNNSDELVIEKKTKKSIKDIDIKSDVINIQYVGNNTINTTIRTGSVKNLKPDLIVQYIYKTLDVPYNKYGAKYMRLEMFGFEDDVQIPLSQ